MNPSSRKFPNGESTETGYRVQVRDPHFNLLRPCALQDGLVGPEWRDVSFVRDDNPAGIPIDEFGHKAQHGLLSLAGATALAWTIIAQNSLYSLECRLTQHELRTTFECEQMGIVEGVITKSYNRDVKLVQEVQP